MRAGSACSVSARLLQPTSSRRPCSSSAPSVVSEERKILRPRAGEYALDPGGIGPVHATECPAQHGARFVQDRVVTILEQRGWLERYGVACDAATAHAAAKHPVDAAVTMVGSTIAVPPERPPE